MINNSLIFDENNNYNGNDNLKFLFNFNGIILILLCIISLIILINLIYSIIFEIEWNNNKKLNNNSKNQIKNKQSIKLKKQAIIILGFYTTMDLCFSICGFCVVFGNTNIFTKTNLENIIPKLYASFYVLANLCSYFFLYTKIEIVSNNMSQTKLYRILKISLKISIILATFILPILTYFTWSGRCFIFDNDEYCIGNLNSYITAIFLVGDSIISIWTMYLFVSPLNQILKQTKDMKTTNKKSNDKLLYVVRRNVILGLVALLSTSFTTAFIAFSGWFQPYRNDLEQLAIIFSCIDLIISTIAICSSTNLWVPKKFKLYFNKITCNNGKNDNSDTSSKLVTTNHNTYRRSKKTSTIKSIDNQN